MDLTPIVLSIEGPLISGLLGFAAGGCAMIYYMQRHQVKGARYATGPHGLDTYYQWFKKRMQPLLRHLVRAVLASLVLGLVGTQIEWGHTMIVIFAAIASTLWGIVGFWLGQASMPFMAWLRLERTGLRHITLDDVSYRAKHTHALGADIGDPAVWSDLVEQEEKNLAINYEEIRNARWPFWLIAVSAGLGGFAGCLVFGSRFAIAVSSALLLLFTDFPMRTANYAAPLLDRLVYHCGCQFVFLFHVKQDAPPRMDLNDVRNDKSKGRASFGTKRPVGPR